jgi:hypothetical protein
METVKTWGLNCRDYRFFQTVDALLIWCDVLFQTVKIEVSTKLKIDIDFRVIKTVKTWGLNCRCFFDMAKCPFSNYRD